MLKSDTKPAYCGGDVFRTRQTSMAENGQRGGNTQNAIKPTRAKFFRIGNAVEQALAASVPGRLLIRHLAVKMRIEAILPRHMQLKDHRNRINA